MLWEDHDEDDEVQVSKAAEKRSNHQPQAGRASNGHHHHHHRRKELQPYKADPFTKRLGRRATSVARERYSVDRNHDHYHGFSTTKTADLVPKWASFDEIPKPGKHKYFHCLIEINLSCVFDP